MSDRSQEKSDSAFAGNSAVGRGRGISKYYCIHAAVGRIDNHLKKTNKFALALTARKVIPALHDSNPPSMNVEQADRSMPDRQRWLKDDKWGGDRLLAKVPPVPVIALEIQPNVLPGGTRH